MPNLRIYARGLPHFQHRFLCRTLNFGVRFIFSKKHFRATHSSRMGRPIPRRSATVSRGVRASVTMVMFMPRGLYSEV